MRADQALGLLEQLLWTGATIAAPLLFACLTVGVLVSVLQVATQLQEMTLSYVPKLIVAVLVLFALGPWMLHQITHFAIASLELIPSLS
jgi:flagellar biosynthesis protein FliQ